MSLTDTRGTMSWNSLDGLQMISWCCGDVGRRWNYRENLLKLSWKDVEKMLNTCFTHDCHDFLIKMTRKVFWSEFFYRYHKQIIYISYTKNGLMRRRFADFRRQLVTRPPEIANLRGIWGFFVGRSREGLEKVSRKSRESLAFSHIFLAFSSKKF